jgi:hypothetical protein
MFYHHITVLSEYKTVVAAAAFPPFANKGKWFLKGEMVLGGGGGWRGEKPVLASQRIVCLQD